MARPGWRGFIKDFEPPRDFICKSVGWLISKNETSITIAASLTYFRGIEEHNFQGNQIHSIVRCSIMRMVELEEPDLMSNHGYILKSNPDKDNYKDEKRLINKLTEKGE